MVYASVELDSAMQAYDRTANINEQDDSGRTCLFRAAQNGDLHQCEALLALGADVNLCTRSGQTPLFIACYLGHERICRLLVQNKANVNARGTKSNQISFTLREDLLFITTITVSLDKFKRTPLSMACRRGDVEMVRNLLVAGARYSIGPQTSRYGTLTPYLRLRSLAKKVWKQYLKKKCNEAFIDLFNNVSVSSCSCWQVNTF